MRNEGVKHGMRGMTMELQGHIYILANKYNNVLYLGVTRDLRRRIAEHKLHINQGFSAKYNTEKLVYYEWYDRLDVAIQREKQLKKWRRTLLSSMRRDVRQKVLSLVRIRFGSRSLRMLSRIRRLKTS